MTIGTDWVRVVAEAIENDIDDNTPYDRAINYIIEAINKHCPFKPDTAYEEVRRIEGTAIEATGQQLIGKTIRLVDCHLKDPYLIEWTFTFADGTRLRIRAAAFVAELLRTCTLDHDALRQELTEKGLPTTPCPECEGPIAPSDLVLYMTTTDGPIRDAAWLRMYAEKIRNGTAFDFDIPNTIATTIDGIANRMLTRSDT